MRRFLPLATSAVLGLAVPAQSMGISLSAPVKHDVQCFMLYAMGVDLAKDDKARQAASLGTMYFVGKLQVGAPGLDLAEAVRQEAEAFQTNPNAKDIGTACDAEVQKRGNELIDLGQQLQSTARQSSASSSF